MNHKSKIFFTIIPLFLIIILMTTIISYQSIQTVQSLEPTSNDNPINLNGFHLLHQKSSSDKIDTWMQINTDGFQRSSNIIPRGIVIFQDTLLVGIASYNDKTAIAVQKTLPIRTFIYELFFNESYRTGFGSDGCEIWAYDDNQWTVIIGRNGVLGPGFGDSDNAEIGVLIEYKGYLYAGVRNLHDGFQIWRTMDLLNWEMVASNGLGNPSNDAIWEAEVFQDELYVGTLNFENGFELFKTSTGNPGDWSVVIDQSTDPSSGFGTKENFYAWSMCVYENELYIGSNNLEGGGELWKTADGITWNPLLACKTVAEAQSIGAQYPRGFTSGSFPFRGGIRNMVVYNDELYLGFTGEDIQVRIQLKNYPLFFIQVHQEFPYDLFYPIQMKNSLGLEIWKYNKTEDSFTKIIGGRRLDNTAGGFGDPTNEYPWSMIVYDDHLYVGTLRLNRIEFELSRDSFLHWSLMLKHPCGGAQLWIYDGNNWEQINTNGFGDEYNIGIREMIVNNNSIIGCTANTFTGCEIWSINI